MPKSTFPTNDLARVFTLNRLLENSRRETPPLETRPEGEGERNLSPAAKGFQLSSMVSQEMMARLNSLVPVYQASFRRVRELAEDRRHAGGISSQSLADLAATVRDCWAVLRRRRRRQGLPIAMLSFFLMPNGKERKVTGSRRRWIQVARELLEGEARAVEAGYTALLDPDAGEIRRHLERAEAALRDTDALGSLLKQAEADLAANRDQVRLLYGGMITAARGSLNHLPLTAQRDVLRQLGFYFGNGDRWIEPVLEEPARVENPGTANPSSVTAPTAG